MKECNGCHISFNTAYKRCPLCNNELLGDDNSYYPNYKTKRTSLVFKIILFISLLIIIASVFFDFRSNNHLTWSKYIILALSINIVIQYFIFIDNDKVLNKLSRIGFWAVILSLVWYIFTGHKVILNFIIPIICILEIIYNTFLIFIIRKNYIKNLITNFGLVGIAIIIMLLKLLNYYLIYNILFIVAIISFIALIIFQGKETYIEFKKIFRI